MHFANHVSIILTRIMFSYLACPRRTTTPTTVAEAALVIQAVHDAANLQGSSEHWYTYCINYSVDSTFLTIVYRTGLVH